MEDQNMDATNDSITGCEIEMDLNSIKQEVDPDSEVDPVKQLIVMNKYTQFNARVKPDTTHFRHKCSRCSEVFQWPHKLKRHIEMVHEGKFPHECTICGKPFEKSYGLKEHMIKHSDKRPYKCNICDKDFKFKGNLNKHVREFHVEGEYQFQCEYCHKLFKTKEKLVIHFVVHETEKNFMCGICGKEFHRKNNLKEHQVIHSSEKKFECPVCGLCFNRKYSLKIHSRNHLEVKPYKCELCTSSFSQLHALKNHMRRHTGEKPFKCSYCDRSFAQQSTLQVHTKRHLGEKNFTCGICEQSFIVKRRLQEHIRVHTGEKPYQCELCPFRAAISSGLKLHMKTHMRQQLRQANMGMVKTQNRKRIRNRGKKKSNKVPSIGGTNILLQTLPQSMDYDMKAKQNGYNSEDLYRSPTLRAMLEKKNSLIPTDIDLKVDFENLQDVSEDAKKIIEDIGKLTKGSVATHSVKIENGLTDGESVESDVDHSETNCSKVMNNSISEISNLNNDSVGDKSEPEQKLESQGPDLGISIKQEPVEGDESEAGNDGVNITRARQDVIESDTSTQDYVYTHEASENGIDDREQKTSNDTTTGCEKEEDFNRIKPEIDPDSKLIVMNKQTKYNCRVKPDTTHFRHKCPKCSEVFQWPHKLKKHIQIVHEGKYPHHCTICGKPFEKFYGLKEHMIKHSDARPHKCDICNKDFKFKGNLNKHIKEIHEGGDSYQFQCEYCQKIFKTKEKLIIHFVVHEKEKKFVCGICGKQFHRKNNLKEHKVIHSSEKQFECPVCGLCFNRKYSLKIHSRNHLEVKPYKCELCTSSFSQLHALKNHMRRHTGEKPFQCSYCDRSFAQQSTLQVHTKRHLGEKNFTCGICQQSFVIKRRLQEHVRVHTGEKPYHCELCPFQSATTSGLKLHTKTHIRQQLRQAEREREQSIKDIVTDIVSNDIQNVDAHDTYTSVKPVRNSDTSDKEKCSENGENGDILKATLSIASHKVNGYISGARNPTLRALIEQGQHLAKTVSGKEVDFRNIANESNDNKKRFVGWVEVENSVERECQLITTDKAIIVKSENSMFSHNEVKRLNNTINQPSDHRHQVSNTSGIDREVREGQVLDYEIVINESSESESDDSQENNQRVGIETADIGTNVQEYVYTHEGTKKCQSNNDDVIIIL